MINNSFQQTQKERTQAALNKIIAAAMRRCYIYINAE